MILSFGFFAFFIPGLLACSLPPFTRYYSVTERTVLAPIVVHARVLNTSESSSPQRYDACIRVEKIIKGRQFNIPREFCLGKYGAESMCLTHVAIGFSYVFFIDEDFTARYDGFPVSSVPASNRVMELAEKGYCDPYGIENEKDCELPTIEYSTFKRVAIAMEGQDLTLPCQYTGTPPLLSTWTKKGQEILSPPGSLTLRDISRKDAGVYTCTIYNPAGKTKERSKVRIRQKPCGGFLYLRNANEQVTIQSPNFPRPFPKDKMCAWRICPPVGKRLEVRFEQFDLRLWDRLDLVNECDRHFRPWQTRCGSASPETFISRCNSSCIRMGLHSSSSQNHGAKGFNVTVTATDKESTKFDVEKLWCDYLVVKAKVVQPFLLRIQIKVIDIYKDGALAVGEVTSVSKNLTEVNIFGCPRVMKYKQDYFMAINARKHVVYAMSTTDPEIPKDFEKSLLQYKKSKPRCRK